MSAPYTPTEWHRAKDYTPTYPVGYTRHNDLPIPMDRGPRPAQPKSRIDTFMSCWDTVRKAKQ